MHLGNTESERRRFEEGFIRDKEDVNDHKLEVVDSLLENSQMMENIEEAVENVSNKSRSLKRQDLENSFCEERKSESKEAIFQIDLGSPIKDNEAMAKDTLKEENLNMDKE